MNYANATMDASNVITETLVELIHKASDLSYNDLIGAKSEYCWNEIIMKMNLVELLEDPLADKSTKKCAKSLLSSTIDRKIVSEYHSAITVIYTPVYEQSYRGLIPSAEEFERISTMTKTEGWWWRISGEFTHSGTEYHNDDEIYWNNSGFHFFGGSGSGSSSSFTPLTVSTGPLIGGEPKLIPNALGRRPFMIQVFDQNWRQIFIDILPTPGSETTSLTVSVEESTSEGYTITLI